MKLPSEAYIDPRKITDYLLKPLEDSDKSAFLARAGDTEDSPEDLSCPTSVSSCCRSKPLTWVRLPSAASMASLAG